MRVTIRQGIVAAPTVASAPNFLQNSGGNVNIVISSVPVIFTFAHGAANYLAAEQASVTNAWGPFTGPTVNYLYWELDEVTGEITRGATTLLPVTLPDAPVGPATGQMWFNTTNNTMNVWNGATWKTTIRVLAGQATGGSATAQALGSQVGLTGSFKAGYLLRDGTNRPIRVTTDINTGAQFKFLTSETELVSAGNDGSVVKLENAAVFVRSGEVGPIPAFSLVYAYAAPAGENTAMLVGLASSSLADYETKAPIGIVDQALALNEVAALVTSGIVYNDAWNWTEGQIGKPLYCGTAGEVTLTKPDFAKVRCIGNVFSAKEILLNFGWETDFDPSVGPTGPAGADGADGNTILSGVVNPTTEGVNGDFYLNTATNMLFGPKAAGVWPAGVSLVGPTGSQGVQGNPGTPGADGKTVLSGAVDPTTEGVDGDFYINTVSSTLFGPKAAGVWPAGVSLVGPAGPAAAETLNQVVYGTGAAVDSSPSFQWIESDKRLRINSAAPSSNHLTTTPGTIQIYGARASASGTGGAIQIRGGQGGVTDGDGGTVQIDGGSANVLGNGGQISITGGIGYGITGNGGDVMLYAGNTDVALPGNIALMAGAATTGPGGSVTITATAGAGFGTDQNGGSVTIVAGDKFGNGVAGDINLTIPATGTLKVNASAGTAGQALVSNGPNLAPTWQTLGGGVTEPANQLVFGTGTGVDSSASFTYNDTTKGLVFNGATVAAPADITITAAGHNGSGTGAYVDIAAGAGGTTLGSGGQLRLYGGDAPTDGDGGTIRLDAGSGTGTGQGGQVQIYGGTAPVPGTSGGRISMIAGSVVTGKGGNVEIRGGASVTTGDGGDVVVISGLPGAEGNGGDITITASAGVGTNKDGGDITITAGAKTGSGVAGVISLASVTVLPAFSKSALPPGVAGGVIYVSDASPNPAMCFYNGTAWIDVVTGVAVV